jgi:formimidoylglutamate deiminase
MEPSAPIHIHVAEQVKEVEDCQAWSRQRPIEWLLNHAAVDERWCLVHCTQGTSAELRDVASRGAVAGLCPTTEANLGDGPFPLRDFLETQGRFGIGTDSNVCTSPVEELRLLEYGQRLIARRRNVSQPGTGAATGAWLYRQALAGGTQASGRPIGAIEAGRRADLLVLDPDHPVLCGRFGEALIDSWVFSGCENPVRDVMVGGRWVVKDGTHIHQEPIARAYRTAIARLASS